VRGVDLVTSMEPVRNPTAVVSRLPGIIADARGRADVVLIDSSPLLVTSDAVDVLRYADAALVACRVGKTTYGQASRARRLLQRADVKLLGIVLTGTAKPHGTPYGQLSRRQLLLARFVKWAQLPGPERTSPELTGPDRTASGFTAQVTPGRSEEEEATTPADMSSAEPVEWEETNPGEPIEEPPERSTTGHRRRPTQSSRQ
jgi:hypothetical protein